MLKRTTTKTRMTRKKIGNYLESGEFQNQFPQAFV